MSTTNNNLTGAIDPEILKICGQTNQTDLSDIDKKRLEQRIWSNVMQTTIPNVADIDTHCIEPCNRSNNDYSILSVDGSTTPTHRIAMMLHHDIDKLPFDVVIHHKCSNKMCCNVFSHLEFRTRSDNTKIDTRPRYAGMAGFKISPFEAEEIRDRYESGGETYDQIADDYDVCPNTIGNIVNGRQIDERHNNRCDNK